MRENRLNLVAALTQSIVYSLANNRGGSMSAWLVCFFLFAIIKQSSFQEFKLPSYMSEICYRDDPKVESCLKKAIEKYVTIFKTGLRDFNLDTLDPLVFPSLLFNFKSPIVGGNLRLTDTRVYGLSKLRVVEVRPKLNNPEKVILNFDVAVPYARINAKYNLTGNIARQPVNIYGFAEGELEYVNMTYHLAGDVKKIGQYDFIDLKKFYWRLQKDGIKNARLTNDNLVANYPGLNQVLKTLVNSSWRILKDTVLPLVHRETEDTLREMFSAFFKKYPYDVIFPRTKIS